MRHDDLIPSPPVPPGRRIGKWLALGVGLVVLVSLMWWAVPELRCGGFSGVRYTGGECVGVTDGSFVFDPEFRDIEQKIKAENDWVVGEAENEGVPYVKIALLTTLTPTDSSPMHPEQVRSSLEGAYVALRRANRTRGLGDPDPLIQLHLANEGSVQAQWPTAVAQLEQMVDDDAPLVAVVGQGVSTASTIEAAERLSQQGIPMVTGATTADGLDHEHIEGMLRIAPSNTDFTTALRQYLDDQDDLESGLLVQDSTKSDTFVTTLREAYRARLEAYIEFPAQPFPGASVEQGGPDVFYPITQNICSADPDMVFFAGRAYDLEIFLEALSERICRARPLTVFFAEVGLYPRGDEETHAQLDEGKITVLQATGVDPGWARGETETPVGFEDFYAHYRELPSSGPETLDNGYAITYHDTIATAVSAIRLTNPLALDEGPPSLADVRGKLLLLNEEHAVQGASGTLSFTEDRGGNPGGKHIPIVPYPYSGDVAATDPYITPVR
ncbi:ABC transporter substrate-binding protein [Allosalinactinospora lopnorensis]|uniref:ABC transporter substrate-binding protein n=1 Tax=Allosalinactinospora lopnorensis TaxID=1352348 RepID=UPI000696800D|nr:ABC transporter substrate-binding protein [Allosalinactinospora lopnorensis]